MVLRRPFDVLSAPLPALVVVAPLVWWGAFAPPLLWILPVTSLLLWHERKNVRALDVAQFAFVLLGLFVAFYEALPWFPATTLVLRFAITGYLLSSSLRIVTSSRPNRFAWGLGALGVVWLSAPSGVGLCALLASAFLAAEVGHRARQDRALVVPRGVGPLLVGVLALGLAGGLVSLARVDVTYRDPGGTASPFTGFRFGWPSEIRSNPPQWLSWLPNAAYALVVIFVLLGLAALLWTLFAYSRTALEDWQLRFAKPKPTLEEAPPPSAPSPEGVRRLYARFLAIARTEGFTRRADETSLEFEARVKSRHPAWSGAIDDLSRAYHEVRYGEVPSRDVFDAASAALRSMEGDA
ncbi:DUF4129 domain-containing protein [Deinococcus yavapaiensis]|uniref:Uncharacterized protein DUF4129 n=1 Tax=Deinococcus yavapaiensis KR-236 TaxID=694435 RepID=A0A318SA88_9DEIO|nr:DUF4129 domain-containing protein [Deinococcus yavapaiensis]PYE56269.1 uncharacterized protein DUF4129 [Deinococcus yavapaiensis KR-236]